MISFQKILSCSLVFSSFCRLITNKKHDFVECIKRASTFSCFVLYPRDLVDNLAFFSDLPKNSVCQLKDFWADQLKDFDFSNQTENKKQLMTLSKLRISSIKICKTIDSNELKFIKKVLQLTSVKNSLESIKLCLPSISDLENIVDILWHCQNVRSIGLDCTASTKVIKEFDLIRDRVLNQSTMFLRRFKNITINGYNFPQIKDGNQCKYESIKPAPLISNSQSLSAQITTEVQRGKPKLSCCIF